MGNSGVGKTSTLKWLKGNAVDGSREETDSFAIETLDAQELKAATFDPYSVLKERRQSITSENACIKQVQSDVSRDVQPSPTSSSTLKDAEDQVVSLSHRVLS